MNLYLEWNNDQSALDITDELIAKLERLLALAGEQEGIESGEVALSFVGDETIQRLNKEYRGIDRPTDVLSFAMSEMGEDELEINYSDLEDIELEADAAGDDGSADDEAVHLTAEPLGDIVISVPRAIAQAEEYGHSVEREIGFLFVHGFLHLIGYDHESAEDEKTMFDKQERILQKAGLTR